MTRLYDQERDRLGRRRRLRRDALEHADVVNLEPLRPDALVHALLAAPVAADGDVEQDAEVLVERPLPLVGLGICQTLVGKREVGEVVDGHAIDCRVHMTR